MKICMDGLSYDYLMYTGLYSYIYELVEELLEIYPQPLYYFISKQQDLFKKWENKNRLSVINPVINRLKDDYKNVEQFLVNHKVNVYHSPNNGFSIPMNKVCNMVISVQDLLPLINQSYVDDKYLKKFHRVFPRAVELSDKIVAVSKQVKKDLIQRLNVSEEKIEVIYPICSDIFKPMDPQNCKSYLHGKYGIQNNYLFFAGSIHPRKNLDTLINVYMKTGLKDFNTDLVIVGKIDGKRSAYYNYLIDFTRKLNIQNHVIFCGSVPYEDMPYFYNAGNCFINLSSYEGFPQTVMEAIACNKTVICSLTDIFTEVVGNEGILVKQDDEGEIKEALLDSISSNHKERTFGRRNEFLNRYDGNDCTRKLIRIYEGLVYG